MGGYITDDQYTTRLPFTRDIDGYIAFDEDCTRLVPGLIALVNAQNDVNFAVEPKNRMDVATGHLPERGELGQIVITPAMIGDFVEIVEEST
ncbi:hypothetical protein NX059_008136 [Plenodomus lindquistii]|nr:hypothetical protein NX059_008136 [Plenodomus lindquistii]